MKIKGKSGKMKVSSEAGARGNYALNCTKTHLT